MMSKWFLIISFILLTGTVCTLRAEPFAVQAANDINVGNDPASASSPLVHTERDNGEGLHIRNVDIRRRVAFVQYDISDLKESGKVFYNTFLSLRTYSTNRTGPFSVWGIKEELDHTIDYGTICWDNAPGVMNDPLPPENFPVELDYADLSPVLIASYNGLVSDGRVSTPASPALADFLNEDTDGIIVLMFAETGIEKANAIVRPVNFTNAGTGYGTPELFGVVLAGEKGDATRASYPNPANNSTVSLDLSQLSWTKPDPNLPSGTVTCDVYFHEVDNDPNTSDDPNYALPDYGYMTLATGITNNFVSLPTPPLPLVKEKTYRWIVDCHDSGREPEKTQGSLWTFNTNNIAPVVDPTDNQYVWLNNAGDPATATVSFGATVTDDGYPNPSCTVLWTQDSGPAVTISPNNVEDVVNLVLPQTGTYRFRLTANDGALSRSGTIQIFVGATPCDAAKAVPGYTPFDGDFNNDCYVDLSDFVGLAQHWLECNSLMPCN